jgi:tetratricopeptide (TPR) repeat protein
VPIRVVTMVVVLAALFGRPARAQPAIQSAREHFDRGAALATERKYDDAAREFAQSYELDPRKEALFAWAQAERLRGDCAKATELYRKLLASGDLTAAQVEAAELNIKRCEREKEEVREPVPPVVAPPVVKPAPLPAAMPPPEPPHRSRRAVVLSAVMAGGAVAALGGATTFFILSRNDERDAGSQAHWDEYYPHAQRARSRQRWAAGLMGGAVLLGAGAVLEWVTSAPGPRLEAWLGPGTAGLGVTGRY